MDDTRNATIPIRTTGRSIKAVATDLGISPGLVRLEIARGRLKAARIGRRVIISDVAMQQWLNASPSRDEWRTNCLDRGCFGALMIDFEAIKAQRSVVRIH